MADVFTPDEVVRLAAYQSGETKFGTPPFRTRMHPFTCPDRGDGRHREVFGDKGALVPTVRGWICPFCDYIQDWAHGFMKAEAGVSGQKPGQQSRTKSTPADEQSGETGPNEEVR